MAKVSKQHSFRSGRGFAPVTMTQAQINEQTLESLRRIGVDIPAHALDAMAQAHGFDANDVGIAPASPAPLFAAGIPTPVQFLQAWLPGFVRTITTARKIDELVGISTAGSFEDEEIVQGVLEPIGAAVPYTDHGNVPLMSWNPGFERRTIVRFEAGMQVGMLEEARTARVRISTSAEKRASAALALDIQRNRVGFYGYNSGANRTYGFLNEPSLSAYVTLPNGASGNSFWSGKTMLEIVRDLRLALSSLRTRSGDTIDPKKVQIVIAVGSNAVDFLTTTSEFGNSVLDWLDKNYPNVRIESAPELNDANGGVGVMYIYAESADDGATDDGRTWVQAVPTKFMALGVEKRVKSYLEDYANATAGVLLKRPYLCARYTGVMAA